MRISVLDCFSNCVFFLFVILCVDKSDCHNFDLEPFSIFYGTVRNAENILKDSECRDQLANITKSFHNRETWALKLYDASGSPSTGLHWGHTYWLGSRQQCLQASRTDYDNLNSKPFNPATDSLAVPPFEVDYFLAYLRHHSDFQISVYWDNETKISLGLCLPSSCSELDVFQSLREYVNSGRFLYQYLYNSTLDVLEVKRTVEDFHVKSPLFVGLMIICSSLCLIVITATIIDMKNQESKDQITTIGQNQVKSNGQKLMDKKGSVESVGFNLLLTFSATRNFQKVFNVSSESQKFNSISGLRVYTTLFVIISHSFLFLLDFIDNRVQIFDSVNTYPMQVFLNSSFSTDAFFCMSGFLMGYGFFKSKTDFEDDWCSLTKSYLKGIYKRFMRLTPAYLFVMLVTMAMATWRHSVDSLWINERNDIVCKEYWWTNLLYINNIYPGRNMCMYWTHYLALEMQFFILVTFCCHLSKKFFKTAATLLHFMFFGSVLCLGYTTYIMNYKPYSVNFYRYIEIFYYPPWMRIGSYIIGTLYGYYYTQANGRLDITKISVKMIWSGVILIMLFLEFGFKDRNLSMFWSIFHTSLSRYLWATCIGWIIIACLTGNGGILNDLLSANVWLPFSRLTYSAYLVNPIVSYTMASFSEKSLTFETFNQAIIASGVVVISVLISVPLTCCIEMPGVEAFNIITDCFSADERNHDLTKDTKIDPETKLCDTSEETNNNMNDLLQNKVTNK